MSGSPTITVAVAGDSALRCAATATRRFDRRPVGLAVGGRRCAAPSPRRRQSRLPRRDLSAPLARPALRICTLAAPRPAEDQHQFAHRRPLGAQSPARRHASAPAARAPPRPGGRPAQSSPRRRQRRRIPAVVPGLLQSHPERASHRRHRPAGVRARRQARIAPGVATPLRASSPSTAAAPTISSAAQPRRHQIQQIIQARGRSSRATRSARDSRSSRRACSPPDRPSAAGNPPSA